MGGFQIAKFYNWRFAPLPAELWPTSSATPLRVPVRIGVQRTGQARLQVEATGLRNHDLIVAVNDHVLEQPTRQADHWWTVDLPVGVLVQGVNHVDLCLRRSDPILPPPRVQSVEVHVEGVS